jgi:uncharacterized protein YcfL
MRTLMFTSVILCAVLLTGCASKDYSVYVEAQKSLSRDNTVNEAAKVNALVEMTKSDDPAVRTTGIMLLHQLQQGSKNIVVEPPKKNWLGF